MHVSVSGHSIWLKIERLVQWIRGPTRPTHGTRSLDRVSPEPPAPPHSGPPDSQRDANPDTPQVFHALIEGVREGAAILATNRTVLTCNRRLAEMLKLECAAVIGRSMLAFIPDDDHPRFEEFLSASSDDFSKLEFRLSGGNAFPLPVECSIKSIGAGDDKVYGLLATDLSRRRRAEEHLAFQAHLLGHVSDAVLATDEHFRITHWNPAAERLYGWTAEEVLGRTISEVVRPEISPGEKSELNRALAEQGQFENESWHHGKGGARIWVQAKRSALRGPEGRLLGYVSINRDVTEHKRAEQVQRGVMVEIRRTNAELESRVAERTAEIQAANQALQREIAERQAEILAREQTELELRQVLQSREDAMLAAREMEELLRIGIETAGMVAWTYDPASDEVVTIARTAHWAQIMSEESVPLLGRGLEYVHPDDRAKVTEALPRVLAGEAFALELRLLLSNGDQRWTMTQGRLLTPPSRTPSLLVGVTQDITDRKRAESEIESAARFPAENPSPILRLDANGLILFANPASAPVLAAWGVTTGRTIPELLRVPLANALTAHRQSLVEMPVGERTFLFTIAPIEEAGYINVYGQDVTDRKRYEENIHRLNQSLQRRALDLEIANRELESFSYSVSHDLRTPVATIEGLSRALQDDYGKELSLEAQRYVGMIHAGAQQVERLIQSLLSLSRLSRQAIQPVPVNMAALVRESLEALRTEVERPGLTIELHALSDALADPVLLKQVWVNLIANAVKFTRRCETARIQIGSGPADGEARVYYVRDNGVGFEMAQVDQLFRAFQRLHGEDEYEGTGIGLSIVARIVNRHGGRVWAEGQVDKGATFYFTLGE